MDIIYSYAPFAHKALDGKRYVHTTRTPLGGIVQTFISSLGNGYGIFVAQCYITKKDSTVCLFSGYMLHLLRKVDTRII